jgi:hypothetical protein
MAIKNKSVKKTEIKTHVENKATKSVAKDTDKGLMSIAEVRMLMYVVPIALILALFVYIITR